MKKRFGIILSALLLSLSAYAAKPELNSDTSNNILLDTAETSYEANLLTDSKDAYLSGDTIPAENIIPGINIYTGNKTPVTFEDPNSLNYFGIAHEWFPYEIATDAAHPDNGNMLHITHDVEKHAEDYNTRYPNNDGDPYAYGCILETHLGKAVGRPGALIYDVYGSGPVVAFWINSVHRKDGATHVDLGNISPDGLHIAVDNASNDTRDCDKEMTTIQLQYCRHYECAPDQYFDNFAFIPYYKATYVIKYPDGSSAESKEVFFLGDLSAITVNESGELNIPTSYIPDEIELTFSGYSFLGWATEENAISAMSEISLANEDITLYPVWEKKTEAVPVALTVYLDADKTVSSSYNLYAGDEFTLPTYYDLTEYTPDGMIPTGFELDGKLYAPGKTLYLPDVSVLTAEAKYGNPPHPEYGELVFLENFESIKNGTYLRNPDTGWEPYNTPISYINPDWSTDTNHFSIAAPGTKHYVYVTDDGTGNNVLKIQKTSEADEYPQFWMFNSSTTPVDGIYTLVVDYYFPEASFSHINNIAIRTYTTDADYYQVGADKSDADTWKTLSMSTTIAAGSVDEALKKFMVYTHFPTSEDAYLFIDNIALYVIDKSVTIKLDDENTKKIFFASGDEITLPYAYENYDKIPAGYTLTGYKSGDNTYKPGEILKLTDDMAGNTYEAVYEKTKYSLSFDLGNANGTVGEIQVVDGDTVSLPEFAPYNATLSGWKPYGSETVYKPGDSFTFTSANEKVNLDGTNRLVFTAVYENALENTAKFKYNYKLSDGMFAGATDAELSYIKLAYGAGIIPAASTFDANAAVSFAELVKTAERLHYRSQNVAKDFLTDNARLSDMVEKGICGNYENLNTSATFADAAVVLANALPHSYYTELVFDVKVSGLAQGDQGYDEALKLIRAGILPESTDFSANITYTDLVKAIAKTVQPSAREVENKRKLYILGDSLTVTNTAANIYGWATKLDQFLDSNIEIVNNGIGGINTGTYFDKYHFTGAYDLYTASLKNMKKGDYVVIALGTNDSTLWSWGDMTYEESRDNYFRYINEIRAQGGIPILVCPVGRNTTDENGVYIESDPLIIQCMIDVNSVLGADVAIINFKAVSFDRLSGFGEAGRAEFYADETHYTEGGAYYVAAWFKELVDFSSDNQLSGLKTHLNEVSFDFDSEDGIYSFEAPVTDKVTSVRTNSPSGIRFRASIDKSARVISDDAVEYGFIVTRTDFLNGKELTHSTDVIYVTGTAYNNVFGTDIIYGINTETDDIVFTGVLINIPETKDALQTKFTVRSFVKVGTSYFYGETHEDSIYDAAKRLENTNSEYVKNIIEICEK